MPSVDLEQWFELLWEDLVYANIYYQLWKELLEASSDFTREFDNAPQFWGLSLRAYLDSTVLRLCRIYDKTREARSLPTLLKFIRRNPQQFSRDCFIERVTRRQRDKKHTQVEFAGVSERQLNIDETLVSGTDANVKVLLGWRDVGYAHFGQELLSPDWKHLKPQPLLPEIPTLLDRAFEILNRYNGPYDGTHHPDMTIQNWNDYHFLLQALRKGVSPQY